MTWYNNSWNYRKSITVSNSGPALTDYQTLATIDTASLVTATKMRSDCGDIRFVDSDDSSLLNYWIGSGCNTASTKIWVKIPSIPSGTKTIYLYYGNSSATYDNSLGGRNTFIVFDDFATGSTEQWTEVDAGSKYTIDRTSNHRINITGQPDTAANQRIYIDKGSDIGNFIYDFTSTRTDSTKSTGLKVGVSDTNNNPLATTWYDGVYYAIHINSTGVKNWGMATRNNNAPAGGNWVNYNWVPGTIYYFSLTRLGDVFTLSIYTDPARTSLLVTYTATQTGITGLRYIYAITNYGDTANGASGWITDIRIRKYTSPEPTYGPWGIEELSGCATPSANLIVLEILSEQLSRQYPSYIDLDVISKLLDNFT